VTHAKSILLIVKVLWSSSVLLNKLLTFDKRKLGNLTVEESQFEVPTVCVPLLVGKKDAIGWKDGTVALS
jgi:hypothetical protein